jgi:hypothetical protein
MWFKLNQWNIQPPVSDYYNWDEELRMLTAEELWSYKRSKPFRPFRLRMADGRSHEVRYSEMILPSQCTVVIGIPDPELKNLAAGDSVLVSPEAIEKLEYIEEESCT